jgi:hypothetical protein
MEGAPQETLVERNQRCIIRTFTAQRLHNTPQPLFY